MADFKKLIDDHIHYSQSLAAVSQIEKLSQKRGKNTVNERFKVTPDTYYPNTYMNRNELRQEMNRKSETYQDLRRGSPEEIGQLHVEFLQCFGLPTSSAFREVSAFGIAVCGSHAFSTDIMPPVGNPMWLCKMQRAGIFPLKSAYQRLYAGMFDHGSASDKSSASVKKNAKKRDEFIGRVVIDIARLRPGCVYDITLPLRQSAHVFSREARGAIRLRIHLHWNSERAAVASYLPSLDDPRPIKSRLLPNEQHQIHCLDEKAFRNVAQVVHGKDMQGKFSMSIMKATLREFNFLRIHYFRYLRKRELYNLRWWIHPFISGFVFVAWMHAVYANTVRYVPAHIVTFLLLHLYRNYAYYAAYSGHGFKGPSIEELFLALLYGTPDSPKKYIVPLNMERAEYSHDTIHLGSRSTASSSLEFDLSDSEDIKEADEETNTVSREMSIMSTFRDFSAKSGYREMSTKGSFHSEHDSSTVIPIRQIAEHMRQALPVKDYKSSMMTTYKDCFTGTEAVNFLLTHSYADTRAEAVVLGNRLANETKLFEHITRKYQFEDMPYRYQFLEYDSQTYVITGRKPRGERFFRLIGFLKDEDVERYKHVEFPFASEKDDPRLTVEESIVIRSLESKKEQEQRLKKEKKELHKSDSFEFDIQSVDDDDKMFLEDKYSNADNFFGGLESSPKAPPQRGLARAAASFRRLKTSSTLKRHSTDIFTHVPLEVSPRIKQVSTEAAAAMKSGLKHLPLEVKQVSTEAAAAMKSGLKHIPLEVNPRIKHVSSEAATAVKSGLERANYRMNPNNRKGNLDRQSFRMSRILGPTTGFESYGDVIDVSQRLMDESLVIEEKTLVKPPPQDVNQKDQEQKTSFAKTVSDARHEVHGVFGHIFHDRVFKVDHSVHAKENDPDDEKDRVISRKDSGEKKTPYQYITEENSKILQINRYSHSNQLVNRIGGVVQPVVEILQIAVYIGRALFNIYTWQDPIFSFWFAIFGPVLVVILYIAPYRIIFGVIGAVFMGPHNWALRVYREQQPGYQPPNFDKIVRKKRRDQDYLDRQEKEFSESTIFSSTATGGNHHGSFDRKKLRTVVVPTSVLKYNHRFYEWPPEAKYARVYQSSAEDLFRPMRQQRGGNMRTIEESDGGEDFEYESVNSSYDDDDSSGSSGLLNAHTERFSAGRVPARAPRRGSLINPGEFRQKVAGLTDLRHKRKSKTKDQSRVPGNVNVYDMKTKEKLKRQILGLKKKKI